MIFFQFYGRDTESMALIFAAGIPDRSYFQAFFFVSARHISSQPEYRPAALLHLSLRPVAYHSVFSHLNQYTMQLHPHLRQGFTAVLLVAGSLNAPATIVTIQV